MTLPNQLTILRIILTPAFIILVLTDDLVSKYIAGIVFFIASLTDLYDGYIARRSGSISKWGKFLDPLADKILIISALVCLTILHYVEAWMVVLIAARDFVVTAIRTYAFIKDISMNTLRIAKWKTALQSAAVYFLLAFLLIEKGLVARGETWAILEWIRENNIIDIVMYIVTIYTVITGIVYVVINRAHLKSFAAEVSIIRKLGKNER